MASKRAGWQAGTMEKKERSEFSMMDWLRPENNYLTQEGRRISDKNIIVTIYLSTEQDPVSISNQSAHTRDKFLRADPYTISSYKITLLYTATTEKKFFEYILCECWRVLIF